MKLLIISNKDQKYSNAYAVNSETGRYIAVSEMRKIPASISVYAANLLYCDFNNLSMFTQS